jgi:hypothetical protein
MNVERRPAPERPSLPALSAVVVLSLVAFGTASADDRRMTLQSATFEDGGRLPLSMVNN